MLLSRAKNRLRIFSTSTSTIVVTAVDRLTRPLGYPKYDLYKFYLINYVAYSVPRLPNITSASSDLATPRSTVHAIAPEEDLCPFAFALKSVNSFSKYIAFTRW